MIEKSQQPQVESSRSQSYNLQVQATMQTMEDILYKVTRPARYIGGEWNSICKDWDKTPVRFVLAFPDTYEVGMSNMAIPILYRILNNQHDVLAERVYTPWIDFEA